jgi:serine/threonine protein kinase
MSRSLPRFDESVPPVEQADGGGYLAGDLIADKYRLVRTLGHGGMGVVWVARNIVLDVDVAIKLIGINKGGTMGGVAKRLLQEARTAAQLSHPAICRTFDYGQTHLGDPFIVSELMHGETLGEMIDSQLRMSPTRAAQILLPVIDGLAVAHAQGIVHRDVKPDNIFLARDVAGRLQPKLLDFGIARFVEEDSKLTVDGSLLGTPSYMSPEQARGEAGADFRTDVWSVSIVLYEAITGELPFEGHNYNAILYAVINESAPSIVDRGCGDKALWRLLERGLHKQPEERWQSMRELGEALALWLYEAGVREDVCGASLRTTWLEAGLSDVQMELPAQSIIPPAMPHHRGALTDSGERPSRRRTPAEYEEDDIPTLEGSIQRDGLATPPPSRRNKPLMVAAVALLAVAAGAVGFVFSRDASAPAVTEVPAEPAGSPADAEDMAEEEEPAVIPAEALPMAEPSEEAAPPPTPRARAKTPTYSKKSVAKPAAAPAAAPHPTPPRRVKKKKHRDFGF